MSNTTLFGAVRLDVVSNREWIDLDTLSFAREAAAEKSIRHNQTMAAWAKNNPVQRISEFRVSEVKLED